MEAFATLYQDLTITDMEKLLDLDNPAFQFISTERFKQSKFPDHSLAPARKVLNQNSQLVCMVIKLLLPPLAKGWERQRCDQYDFGTNPDPEARDKVKSMDQEKLKQAPINNLDPERSVGFINHERSIRGATQIAAASRALISGKGSKLIDVEVTDVPPIAYHAKSYWRTILHSH